MHRLFRRRILHQRRCHRIADPHANLNGPLDRFLHRHPQILAELAAYPVGGKRVRRFHDQGISFETEARLALEPEVKPRRSDPPLQRCCNRLRRPLFSPRPHCFRNCGDTIFHDARDVCHRRLLSATAIVVHQRGCGTVMVLLPEKPVHHARVQKISAGNLPRRSGENPSLQKLRVAARWKPSLTSPVGWGRSFPPRNPSHHSKQPVRTFHGPVTALLVANRIFVSSRSNGLIRARHVLALCEGADNQETSRFFSTRPGLFYPAALARVKKNSPTSYAH